MSAEDRHYNRLLNEHLDSLVEEEEKLVIDPELKGWERGNGEYFYPCAECGWSVPVDDPYKFDSTDHVCCDAKDCENNKLIAKCWVGK